MKEIQILSLLCIAVAAVQSDLRGGTIPNGLIATGLLWGGAYQAISGGIVGITVFFGGALLPVLLFGVFYFFRMTGAGDVKLMCVVGGFLGPSDCFSCIAAAVFFGGLISLVMVLRRRSFGGRLLYFANYMNSYLENREWRSYLEGTPEEAKFCFSVPVLLGILCYAGGIL